MKSVIMELLYPLGITANYVGYFYVERAIELVAGDPSYLTQVTKRLYPEVAAAFDSKPNRVERNIRVSAELAWRNRRDMLEEMAGYTMPKRPCASQFVAILAAGYQKLLRTRGER